MFVETIDKKTSYFGNHSKMMLYMVRDSLCYVVCVHIYYVRACVGMSAML